MKTHKLTVTIKLADSYEASQMSREEIKEHIKAELLQNTFEYAVDGEVEIEVK